MEGGGRGRVAQPALAVEEREGRSLVADHAHVAHEARLRLEPQVQHARGRLHDHREPARGRQIQRELVRGGRARGGDGAREPSRRRPVHVAADHALHLGMAADDAGQIVLALEPHVVHRLHAGHERRMVHEDHGRARGRFAEARVEPVKPLCAQPAARLPRHLGVQADETDRPQLDRVVQEAAVLRQVPAVGEGPGQRPARVVIARDHVERHGEAIHDRAQPRVFRRLAPLHQIAGGQHHVGRRGEAVEMRHRALQVLGRPEVPVVDAARRADVGVGDLGDEHGPIIH
jgi:hypothetical protein